MRTDVDGAHGPLVPTNLAHVAKPIESDGRALGTQADPCDEAALRDRCLGEQIERSRVVVAQVRCDAKRISHDGGPTATVTRLKAVEEHDARRSVAENCERCEADVHGIWGTSVVEA